MEFSLDTLHGWLAHYGVAVFALAAFVDTFGPTGLVSPASLLFPAAGYFCAEGLAPTWPSLLVMWGAAFVGNLLTYGLGRLSGGWLPSRVRRHVPRVRRMLEREGPVLLVAYHFANPLRALVPVLCGNLGYPLGRYLLYSTPGLMAWIGGLFAMGYFGFHVVAGADPAWQRVLSGLALTGMLVLGWYVWRGLKRAGDDLDAEDEG
ncbi:MAG TPA: alkaline phosphatase [Firmicutes bacterium]|nr:alkaline phosphatase [Bacillota bacterium]